MVANGVSQVNNRQSSLGIMKKSNFLKNFPYNFDRSRSLIKIFQIFL